MTDMYVILCPMCLSMSGFLSPWIVLFQVYIVITCNHKIGSLTFLYPFVFVLKKYLCKHSHCILIVIRSVYYSISLAGRLELSIHSLHFPRRLHPSPPRQGKTPIFTRELLILHIYQKHQSTKNGEKLLNNFINRLQFVRSTQSPLKR